MIQGCGLIVMTYSIYIILHNILAPLAAVCAWLAFWLLFSIFIFYYGVHELFLLDFKLAYIKLLIYVRLLILQAASRNGFTCSHIVTSLLSLRSFPCPLMIMLINFGGIVEMMVYLNDINWLYKGAKLFVSLNKSCKILLL